jgi:VWFA-related protein
MPQRFLALYFDDLNTSDADMIQARDAADHYLVANLQPQDRVAIFTSGKILSDFTADLKQIHEALSKLHTSPMALTRIHNCPELSDYQALEITEHDNPDSSDAWKMAIDEKEHRCDIIKPRSPAPGSQSTDNPSGLTGAMPSSGSHQTTVDQERETTIRFIAMLARSVVDRAAMQSRANLQELDQLVKYISQMPGQRNVILISPGFLSQSEQYQLDGIIDRALRAQVVISSLDPKGLAVLMREADATIDYMPTANSGAIGAMHNVDWSRELVASDVLAEVAYGTGGEFFHNNNDLRGGFRALAGSPVYYILAFAPNDIKQDGKFHSLRVTLAEAHTGLTLQARRGYFAPMSEAEAAETEKRNSSDAEAQASEQVREAILSRVEIRQFSVEPFARLSSTAGEARELSLRVHLDGKSLRLRKDADDNRNTVIFTCAIYDQKENLLMSQQVRTKVSLRDAQLQEYLSSGVDVDMTFKLKPGAYRVREVVTDTEEHHMTAFSRNMKIP